MEKACFQVHGKLLLADLGYYCTDLFNKLDCAHVWFLFRVKTNAKVRIIETWLNLGQRCKDQCISDITRKRADVVVFKGLMDGLEKAMTFVGFWHQEEKKYRWYITNLNCDMRFLHNVYKLRWQIEILFKGLKTHLSFDEIPSGD